MKETIAGLKLKVIELMTERRAMASTIMKQAMKIEKAEQDLEFMNKLSASQLIELKRLKGDI